LNILVKTKEIVEGPYVGNNVQVIGSEHYCLLGCDDV